MGKDENTVYRLFSARGRLLEGIQYLEKVEYLWEKSKIPYVVYYPPGGCSLEEIQYLEKVEHLCEKLEILYIVYYPPHGRLLGGIQYLKKVENLWEKSKKTVYRLLSAPGALFKKNTVSGKS